MMSTIPSQKGGNETPSNARPVDRRSRPERGRMAARMPRLTPPQMASSSAAAPSWSVAATRWPITSATGAPEKNEFPRSPRRSDCAQVAYWTGNGWSRPRLRRAWAAISSLYWSPMSIASGPPGARWRMTKRMTETPIRVGIASSRRTRMNRPMAWTASPGGGGAASRSALVYPCRSTPFTDR